MSLQGQALTTVSVQLWAGINASRDKLIGLLQGATLRSGDEMHALVDEIQAYIAALDTVHGSVDQALADALGVSVGDVKASVAPPAGVSITARPADDISSINRGLIA